MHHISKNAIVAYSCKKMYELVNAIDDYPQFLNWCSDATILKQTQSQITASIKINKGSLKKSFTTVNQLTPFERIDMQLEDGPFEHLLGSWVFKPLGEQACKVNFELEFSFKSPLTDIAVSPIFTQIAHSQLEAFIARAKKVYR